MIGADLALAGVTGLGRSGTSALLAALAQHRHCLHPEHLGEAPFVGHFLDFLSTFEGGPLGPDYHVKTYKVAEADRLRAFRALIFRLHVTADPTSMTRPRLRYWPAKIALRAEYFETFRRVYPTSPIFYIVRNGIEVVESTRFYAPFKDLAFGEICNRWTQSIQLNAFLSGQPLVAFLRHHELIADPASVMAQAFKTVGMARDPAPARFLAEKVFNSSFEDRGGETRTNLEGRDQVWFHWSAEERTMFEDICGPTMLACGFEIPNVRITMPRPTLRRQVDPVPPPEPAEAQSAGASQRAGRTKRDDLQRFVHNLRSTITEIVRR